MTRLNEPPDVKAIGAQFAALETKTGAMKQLSARDTTRAAVGKATFEVDYSRPLARGRVLLGGIIPYDQVWRTGANAATQFTTSAPITLAGISVPPGKYTLWTVPQTKRVELIVNKQTGQWGTGYNPSYDLGKAAMENGDAHDTCGKLYDFSSSGRRAARDTRNGMGTVSVDGRDRGSIVRHLIDVVTWGPQVTDFPSDLDFRLTWIPR